MNKLFLILPLAALFFATQGWAPPAGKGGAPSKINMPKDQPGHEALDKGLWCRPKCVSENKWLSAWGTDFNNCNKLAKNHRVGRPGHKTKVDTKSR